jgi:uncharacterized protein (DUF302 family)
MSFCFSKSVALPLEAAANSIAAIIERHGMSVVSDIDVNATLRQRLGLDLAGYRILSACHRGLARGALRPDGTRQPMLHLKAVISEREDGRVQITVSGGLDAGGHQSGVVSVADAAEALLREMFSESKLAAAA